MGLVVRFRDSFRADDDDGLVEISKYRTRASSSLDIYGAVQPSKASNGGHVEKTRCERPLGIVALLVRAEAEL